MKPNRVAILRGGPSSEYDISMKTGKSIFNALKDHYTLTDIVIDKNGSWFIEGIEKTPFDAIKHVDLVFNALHGEYGEDGKVQHILESLQVPFTGPKTLSAALSMNKHIAKDIFKKNNLKTPIFRLLTKPLHLLQNEGGEEEEKYINQIAVDLYTTFAMPVVIKPTNKGSSIGVTIARDFTKLKNALMHLFKSEDKILVEEYIEGRQGTVSIIDDFRGEKSYACLPSEICIPNESNILDYDYKYSVDRQDIHPGNFSKEERAILIDMARQAHQALNLRHYSRSDFIIHPKRGVYILETNSLPDISENSLFIKSLEPLGASYKEFLDHIINVAKRG